MGDEKDDAKKTPETLDRLEQVLDSYLNHIGKESGLARVGAYGILAHGLEEGEAKPIYGMMAGEYATMADKAQQDGNHGAAKVYAVLAAHYLSQVGIDMNELLPDGENKKIGEYIKEWFQDGYSAGGATGEKQD